jgi:hypothetical protein
MLLLLAAAVLPSASAQADPAPGYTRLLTDPPGDHEASGQGPLNARFAGTDLLALDVNETGQSYVFVLDVGSLEGQDTELEYIGYEAYFEAKGSAYGIEVGFYGSDGEVYAALMQRENGTRFYRYVDSLPVMVDRAASVFTVTVPSMWIAAPDGSPLLRGEALTGFYAQSINTYGQIARTLTQGAASIQDRMPDTEVGTVAFPVRGSGQQAGTVVATSPQPVRVSNGEATTILFQAEVKNAAERPDTIELANGPLPAGWVVTFPQKTVRLEAGESIDVPILVTIPFSHEHGVLATFDVHFESRSDPLSHATLQYGVRYTKVPQPAGHHDTVWLHELDGNFFINAQEEEEVPPDEAGGSGFGGGCSFSSGGGESGSSEMIMLVPDLDLGIDVDMAGKGLATLNIHSETPVLGSTSVGGYFVVWYGNDRPSSCLFETPPQAIAMIQRSEPLTLDADETVTIELEILPLAYGDFLPYGPDIQMALLFAFFHEDGGASQPICCFDVSNPTLVAGSSFKLPLKEYHDPVDDYFSTLSGIDLYANGDQQRLVNPGKTAVFRLTAENVGTQAGTFGLELTGSNAEWARLLGDTSVQLAGGEKRELAVAISPPDGAFDGDLADVTLHAVNKGDDNVRSLIRLLAEVDTDGDHPDDEALADELDGTLRGKDSPGLALPAGLLALAASGLGRRRRPVAESAG